MMKSQFKVSTISFLIALALFLTVFGLIAYFSISGFINDDETEVSERITPDEIGTDDLVEAPPIAPDEVEKIEGESFTVLIAGYDLQKIGFDAMLVLDVNKETQKATVYPINVDTKVYVGHGDSNSLNVRMGDLIKYKDMNYVLDKLNATTGLKIEYYVTFTAQGFIDAFDAFNKNGDYQYKVPKDMEHLYAEPVEKPNEELVEEPSENPEAVDMTVYNISFKKGDVITKGIDVYNMLRYKGDSASDRITRQATFAKDVIAKIIPSRFKEGNLSAIIDTVKALLELTSSISTNFSAETFITETFDLISVIPSFSMSTVTKYTSGITNFK